MRNEIVYYCPDCREHFPASELNGHFFSCSAETKRESFPVCVCEDEKDI